MKILVDSLPYYNDWCPFKNGCLTNLDDCPRNWDKEYVCSDDNPHECIFLKEIGYVKV